MRNVLLKLFQSFSFFMMLPFLWGCLPLPIPHKTTIIPGVEGKLVDSSTGQPLAGARLSLSNSENQSALTSNEGFIDVPAERVWRYYSLLFLGPFDPGFNYRQVPISLETSRCGIIQDQLCWNYLQYLTEKHPRTIDLGTIGVTSLCTLRQLTPPVHRTLFPNQQYISASGCLSSMRTQSPGTFNCSCPDYRQLFPFEETSK